ncbi:MAG TPA: FAD:protein FMN transferase [Pseudonocardia sp.]|nr:FAD:protein FMN transferase [Pseudonocardia sp.]
MAPPRRVCLLHADGSPHRPHRLGLRGRPPRCRTADPAGRPWRIGIEDPWDPTTLAAVVPLRTGAVATSGSAHRGAHIVDARTGRAPGGSPR